MGLKYRTMLILGCIYVRNVFGLIIINVDTVGVG